MILQSLRNTAWQHVKQHALGFLLLFSQQLMLLIELFPDLVHLHDKVTHQKINDGRHRGEVEREEYADSLHRHSATLSCTEKIIEQSGHSRHYDRSEEHTSELQSLRHL